MATDLLRRLPGRSASRQRQLRSLDDIGNVVQFFADIFALVCPEANAAVPPSTDDLGRLRAIIDSLANDVIGVSLSHIRPEDVLARDRTAVGNLVEILHGLAEFAPIEDDTATREPKSHATAATGRPTSQGADDANRTQNTTSTLPPPPRQLPATAPTRIAFDSPEPPMPQSLRRSYEQLHRLADRTLHLSREALAPAPAAADHHRQHVHRRRVISDGDYGDSEGEDGNDGEDIDNGEADTASSDAGDSGVGGGDGGRANDRLCCGLPVASPRERLVGYVEEHAVRVEEERLRLRRMQRERQLHLAAEAAGRSDAREVAEVAGLSERRRQLERAYRQSERQLRDEVGGGRGVGGGLIMSRARPCPTRKAKQRLSNPKSAGGPEGDRRLLPELLSEFPFLDVSEATLRQMRDRLDRQTRHVAAAAAARGGPAAGAGKNKAAAAVADAERRQRLLVESLRKEAAAAERQREQSERRAAAIRVRALERERRSESAKARQYYDQFVARQRARMLAKRSVEEQVFRRLFTEALQLQRRRIREHRSQARDHQAELHRRTADEVASMENFYRDRFAMLAESLATERRELQVRERAHDHLVRGLARDLRRRMETEVRDIQEQLARDQDDAHFRQLDADQVLARLYARMAEPPQLAAV